ncbi:RepB family plasmid replication initiator protein [Desnuesiella massiliensis]|uniref:RepB family plasmid replication initiator protein n=1 Tax=Desnuesiella massiliensis TaxID=1650662 RepID=UPI0006E2DF3E|nr:RepB family plasmid replication initiator protein [Desnuesiella massiliensis]
MSVDKKRIKYSRKNKANDNLRNVPEFRSIYSKILYIYLHNRMEEKAFYITLEELKDLLMAPALAHTYSQLRIKVLDNIIREFEEVQCPLRFKYEIVKGEKDKVKISYI